MQRALLVIFLGCSGLVLLAAVCIGLLLAAFDPNAYTGQISEAVEKATGRRLQFQGGIVTSLFPSPSLTTGRLVMRDPGIFGGDDFISVESVTVSLAVKPLLQGIVHVEEISLNSPVLRLVTNAAGRNNWDYGFALPENAPRDHSGGAADDPAALRGVFSQSTGTARNGTSAPLTDTASASDKKQGYFSRLVLEVERFRCKGGRVLYRDARTGASRSGSLDSLSASSVRRDADIPFAATGNLEDKTGGLKILFVFSGVARLAATGDFTARFDTLDLTATGIGDAPFTMKNQVELHYDPAGRKLELQGLKGNLDETGYGGTLALVPPGDKTPARITGELFIRDLNLDKFLGRHSPGGASSGKEENVRGAPNLTRPTVAPGGRGVNAHEISDAQADQKEAETGKTVETAHPADTVDGTVAVTVSALRIGKIAVDKLAFTLQAEKSQVGIPFNLEAFAGTADGKATLDLRKSVPALTFAADAKNLDMEKLCLALEAKSAVSGALSAHVDLTGRGGSWKEIAPTLKGKSSLTLQKGEVRGFSLIPSNLQGITGAPADFSFERIAGSGNIDRGILTSKDLRLQSRILTGTGGGSVNLVSEQLELGVDFMIAGQPPAIPVNIAGPFSSPASSVDVRTLMRNTADGAIKSPETARGLLKDAQKLLQR